MENSILSIKDLRLLPEAESTPVLFIGHGNPMNAIENNQFSKNWEKLGQILPKPKAIVCISAHWETRGTYVTSQVWPETIHDFYGFPQELFDVTYKANGDPLLARELAEKSAANSIRLTEEWGLDHGCWSVLVRMYPQADIPVLQLSIDHSLTPKEHFALAGELAFLRNKGVLILASGNLVHNLRLFDFFNQEKQYDWALSMNHQFKELILSGNIEKMLVPHQLGTEFSLAAPTLEHYIPILYALALRSDKDAVFVFNDAVLSSLSMTSFLVHSNSLPEK